jgi:DnaJ family protein B protein 4
VKDIVLDVELHPGRKVRAVRLPAYVATFTHDVEMDEDGKIVDSKHAAIVCGATGAVRVSDDVLCRDKARLLSVLAVSVPAGIASFVAGADVGVLAAQTLMASAAAAGLAGIFARQVPRLRREKEESERLVDEERAFAAATRHGGANVDAAWMDEPTQQRRDDVEWGRWKETDKTNWDEHKREEWAASIWAWQRIRRRERDERRERLLLNRARADEAERRDEEKERRWGPEWRKENPDGGGKHGRGKGFGLRGGRDRDRDGFYEALGLQSKLSSATAEEIKASYRREAMEWHPDKHQGEAAKKRAAKNFRKLQTAYKTLSDANSRRVYDGL